jgi:hypothetical protein
MFSVMSNRSARWRFGCKPATSSGALGSRGRGYVDHLKHLAPALPGLQETASIEYLAKMLRHGERWVAEMHHLAGTAGSIGPDELIGSKWDARRAIVRWDRAGKKEEATWLAFLCILLGERDGADPWASVADLYSGFGTDRLSWQAASGESGVVRRLIEQYPEKVQALKFANHRKFESPAQIPSIVASYLTVVRLKGNGSQARWLGGGSDSPEARFSRLLPEVAEVERFGRLASYDFLVLLGTLHVYPLEPERLYLRGATGPLYGAQRLFGGSRTADELDQQACELAKKLGASLLAMEDALCNWQKQDF